MKPASSLPWKAEYHKGEQASVTSQYTDIADVARNDDAAYIAHAANAYPELVGALKKCLHIWVPNAGVTRAECEALLKKLGEAS